MQTILIIDDDERICELLSEYLGGRGYRVETAFDGNTGLERIRAGGRDGVGYDLVVLDVMLPGLDGLEVCRRLRAFSQVPVIMLTARGEDTDRIVGLELGADDYLPKPFNPRELVARMTAVLRRARPAPAEDRVLRAGPLAVDPDRRVATLDERPLDLTTTEFDILRALVANAGRVIPRERLMELARGEAWAAFERSADVHISHLRRKLGDDPRAPRFIKTVRGVGYTLPRNPG